MRADDGLEARARRHGVQVEWTDVAGRERRVTPDVLDAVIGALDAQAGQASQAAVPLLTSVCGHAVTIEGSTATAAIWTDESGGTIDARRDDDGNWPAPGMPGYWRWQQGRREQSVAVAPARAWAPGLDGAARHWGLAAQVYGLRAGGDGGIGDSAGCLPWLSRIARQGGDALALSPLHAPMPVHGQFSPYSPSDRAWLDPLQASSMQVLPEAVQAVRAEDAPLDAALRALEASAQIDWIQATTAKQRLLDRIPGWLMQHQPQRHAEISAEITALGPTLQQWSRTTTARHGGTADNHAFGQWLARRAWREVQQDARTRGLSIGLIADLAVGFDPEGVEAQRAGNAGLRGLTLGAPPDAFNPHGQAWGISGYAPHGLRAEGYAAFISLLRAVMADRGGVRIDHILGLQRLWVIPQGGDAGQGAYLHMPFDDLLNLLVLESWRHRCVVIGEDLGVVPPGVRARLASRGILGLDVLAFSRGEDDFMPPSTWRRVAVAMTSTHDLPPLAGWIDATDLGWRERLGWGTLASQHAARDERQQQVEQLHALARSEQLEPGQGTDGLVEAAIGITGRSPAWLALVPLEDALGLQEQPNLPGTVDTPDHRSHPNWQQRLPQQVDEAGVAARLRVLAEARTDNAPHPETPA